MIRLRSAPGGELLAVCGLVFAVSGLAVAADGLVAAAQAGAGAARLGWEARLVEGLWRFRLERCLWFTAGAFAFAAGLRLGAELRGWRDPAARVVAGMALGLAVVAAAVILSATDVAIAGRVGSGAAALSPSDRARIATWLLQAITGLAAGGVWLALAVRLTAGVEARPAAGEAQPPPDPLEPPADPQDPDEPAWTRPHAVAAAPAAAPAVTAAPPATAAEAADQLYRERLAFSPRRSAARELVERIGELERQGLAEEAQALLRRLDGMAAEPR